MGLRVENTTDICVIRDIYEGLPPLAVGDHEVVVTTTIMGGIAFLDWPNMNILIRLESLGNQTHRYIAPVPGRVHKVPPGLYRIHAYYDSSKLDGVTAGFTTNPSPAVLALIAGGMHRFIILDENNIHSVVPGNYTVSQSVAALRCIAIPATNTARSGLLMNQGGMVGIGFHASGNPFNIYASYGGVQTLINVNTVNNGQKYTDTDVINAGFIEAVATNNTAGNADINVDLVVVR